MGILKNRKDSKSARKIAFSFLKKYSRPNDFKLGTDQIRSRKVFKFLILRLLKNLLKKLKLNMSFAEKMGIRTKNY